jgi:hypothetical protein
MKAAATVTTLRMGYSLGPGRPELGRLHRRLRYDRCPVASANTSTTANSGFPTEPGGPAGYPRPRMSATAERKPGSAARATRTRTT